MESATELTVTSELDVDPLIQTEKNQIKRLTKSCWLVTSGHVFQVINESAVAVGRLALLLCQGFW
jgi:hypothetical protein